MAWKFFNYLVTDFCLGRRKHIGLTRPVSPVKGVMFTRTSGHQCSHTEPSTNCSGQGGGDNATFSLLTTIQKRKGLFNID